MTPQSTGYALLAKDSYRTPDKNDSIEIDGQQYTVFANADDPATGFQATAYQRKGSSDIVIAYRGTEFDREPVHDGGVDAGMVLLGVNAQAPDSIAFTKEVMAKAQKDAELNDRVANVTVTGHSLGGTLAEINAARFGLKGETFNAYGAASLPGVPSGGTQVIDHVRAGDVVSAASPHFGEVRVYASQQDIDTLSKAGYKDDSGLLSLRNPVKAIDFDSHAIDNFIPESKLLGHSIISDESQARYRAHEGMIDRYRNDVADIRMGLSAAWEIPKAIGEFKDAVERGVEHVSHDIASGIHAVEEKAQGAWNTITHPGTWFEHDKPGVSLDHAAHPDHPMFMQARDAVHDLDRAHGRAPDAVSENVAGSLVVKARQDGLDRIDKAVLSDDASRIYAVQGGSDSPLKRVAEMPTEQAASTSVAESSAQWQQAAQQAQQHAQVVSQQIQTHQERAQPSPGL